MDKLGYKRFGAYGSDWGFEITLLLGHAVTPERLIGTAIPGSPPRANREPRTDEERTYVTDLARWNAEERGYQFIQGSKPQTLAYGLTDSPAGLAAWIVEKLRTWSDCRRRRGEPVHQRPDPDVGIDLLAHTHYRNVSTLLLFHRTMENADGRNASGLGTGEDATRRVTSRRGRTSTFPASRASACRSRLSTPWRTPSSCGRTTKRAGHFPGRRRAQAVGRRSASVLQADAFRYLSRACATAASKSR
jgi:hypothetical protein